VPFLNQKGDSGLYSVYCAKRNSEVAPGVGKAVDVVLTSNKAEAVSEDRIKGATG
jgi:hypothetical protein